MAFLVLFIMPLLISTVATERTALTETAKTCPSGQHHRPEQESSTSHFGSAQNETHVSMTSPHAATVRSCVHVQVVTLLLLSDLSAMLLEETGRRHA